MRLQLVAALLIALVADGRPAAAQAPPKTGELAVSAQLVSSGERITFSFANKSRRPLSVVLPQGMPLERTPRGAGRAFLAKAVELKLAPGATQRLDVPVITVGDCPAGEYLPSADRALAPDVLTVREFMKKADSGAMKYDPVSGRLAVLIRRHGVDGGQAMLGKELGVLRAQQHRNVLSAAGLLPGAKAAAPEPKLLFSVGNIDGVLNGPTRPTTFRLSAPTLVTQLRTYHWNGGRGVPAGTLGLRDEKGRSHGPWKVTAEKGYRDAPNVYWNAYPRVVLPAGEYTVVDSSPATWSHNAGSKNRGFVEVFGRQP